MALSIDECSALTIIMPLCSQPYLPIGNKITSVFGKERKKFVGEALH